MTVVGPLSSVGDTVYALFRSRGERLGQWGVSFDDLIAIFRHRPLLPTYDEWLRAGSPHPLSAPWCEGAHYGDYVKEYRLQ